MNPQSPEQLEMANRAAAELGFGSVKGAKDTLQVGQAVNTLNAATLSSNPAFRTKAARPSTEADGLLGTLEAEAASYTENLERQAQSQEQVKETSLDALLKGLTETPGQTELAAEAYAQAGGVDDTQRELNDINQQLRSEQVGLMRRLEAIQKNPTGMTAQAVNDELDRVKTESLRKQADLSIVQMGIQGRFDSAKAIADRAIMVQLEKQKNRNEALRLNYEENKELFNKKEQRAFEAAQADRERAFTTEKERLQQISDLSLMALQNGAPGATVKAIREAQTPEEAFQLAGSFMAPRIAEDRALERQNVQSQMYARSRGLQLEERRIALAEQEAARATQQAAQGIVPGQAPTGKPDYKAAGYATRMADAHETIDVFGSQFTGAASLIGQSTPNILKSGERQQFEQAQRNFINSVLRRESGAVISEEEFDNARKQYFPQPGDSADVVEQKRLNRIDAINSTIGEAGKAYNGTFLGDAVSFDVTDDELEQEYSQLYGGVDSTSNTVNFLSSLFGK